MPDDLGDAVKKARSKKLRDGLTAAAERQAAAERGSTAPTFTGWRGEWVTGRPYQRGNVVSHEGSSWRALADHDSSEPPSQMWEYVAKKGEKGAKGDRGSDGIGAQGPAGPPGPGSDLTIEDEGVVQGVATTLNFAGAGVTAGPVVGGEALITIAGGAPGTEYNEDTPMQDGDLGTFVLAVRNDTDAVTTDADGDFSQISVDSAGRVKVVGVQTDALTDAELRATPVPVVTQEPISVDDNGGSLTVDGTVAISGGTVSVSEPVSVDDNNGSLTVDAGITLEVTATASSAAVFTNTPIDVSMYRWASFQIGGTWAGTIAYEGSNDSITWFAMGFSDVGVTSTIPAASTTTNTLRHGPLNVKFFRLRFASYSSGTATAIIELIQSPSIPTHTGITTIVPSTGAANLGKAEDAAHASGDTGVAVWGVRNDALAVRTSTDGDYSPISTDSTGQVFTKTQGLVADGSVVTGNPVLVAGQDGTNVQAERTDTTGNQGVYFKTAVGSGGDAGGTFAFPLDEAGTAAVGVPGLPYWFTGSLYVRARGDVTNGLDVDVTRVPAPLSTTGGGTEATALRVTVANDSTGVLSVDDNGGSLTVDGTVAATQSGAWSVTADTELPAAAALADNTANPTAPAVGAFGMMWDGANWDRMPGTSADGVLVNLGANNDVTVAGTVTVTEAGTVLANSHVGSVSASATGPASPAWADVKDFGSIACVVSSSLVTAGNEPSIILIWSNDQSTTVVTQSLKLELTTAAFVLPTLARYVKVYFQNTSAGTTDINAHYVARPGTAFPVAANGHFEGSAQFNQVVGSKQFNGVIKDNNGTDSTVKVAHLDMTTATTTTIVAAVTNKKIRVLEYNVSLGENASTEVNFARGAGTTRVTGSNIHLLTPTITVGVIERAAPTGSFLFETAASENLRVTNSAATNISVAVVYIEVD